MRAVSPVRVALAAGVLLAAVGLASGHICMWSPLQRSPYAVDTPGANPCYLKPGPCGGIPYAPTNPVTKLPAGQLFTVHFQQNLNHYYTQNPGHLEVSLAQGTDPVEGAFQRLGPVVADWNAMDMITQTNFSITVVVPNTPCAQCVLRTRYLSNNPLENDRGEVFHQCADVQIVSADDDAEARANIAHDVVPAADAPAVPHVFVVPHAARVAPKAGAATPTGCCTAASQFVTQWSETGSYRAATQGTTYYDAVNKLMRVDTDAGSGTTIYDGQFTHYCNFTSGIEYYLNRVTGVCEPLGLDYWNDWCYGQSQNQSESYLETITFGSGPNPLTVDVYQNGEFFFGGSADATCTPVLLSRPSKGMMTLYYDFAAGAPDPTVFQPPPQCHLALEDKQKTGKFLRRATVDPRFRDRYAPH